MQVTSAVLFDYGLTLVTFRYPREELVGAMEEARTWIGPGAPDAETLVSEVLEPLEDDLATIGEDEVDYLAFYERAWLRAGLRVPLATLARILDREQRCWDRAVRVAPDALETLEGLRERGVRTAVASNAPFPADMMRRQLGVTGIAERVDAVVFSSEVGRRKPAPELYLAALERLDVEPADALYVGDRVVEDYEGPRRLGMRAVLCTALARTPAPAGVPSIGRLGELLECIR